MYHCLPDEECELNVRREEAHRRHPDKSVAVGRRFVLCGEPAFQIVSAYYQGLAMQGEPEAFREYAAKRHEAIRVKHQRSRSLPVPIDLTEGQLCDDPDLSFFACMALDNGQVIPGTN